MFPTHPGKAAAETMRGAAFVEEKGGPARFSSPCLSAAGSFLLCRLEGGNVVLQAGSQAVTCVAAGGSCKRVGECGSGRHGSRARGVPGDEKDSFFGFASGCWCFR